MSLETELGLFAKIDGWTMDKKNNKKQESADIFANLFFSIYFNVCS